MTADDIRDLRDQPAGFDDIEWIDDATREIVERFMPDLASRLPAKRTETFDQAFGRVRARNRSGCGKSRSLFQASARGCTQTAGEILGAAHGDEHGATVARSREAG